MHLLNGVLSGEHCLTLCKGIDRLLALWPWRRKHKNRGGEKNIQSNNTTIK